MRLYFYRRPPGKPRTLLVETYPVGIGREGWRTPRGKFHIRRKTVNPKWVIPESIRQEHIKEYGDDRHSIAGGDPDNPLGKYRMELSLPPFSIHGTDVPWGIGMQVTHGCVRLYPEDIQRLFPLVPVGTRVEFVYQPVKAGRRDGVVYVEVHRDVYRYGGPSYGRALAALTRQGLDGGVDGDLVKDALRSSTGMPFRVSPGGAGPRGTGGGPPLVGTQLASWLDCQARRGCAKNVARGAPGTGAGRRVTGCAFDRSVISQRA